VRDDSQVKEKAFGRHKYLRAFVRLRVEFRQCLSERLQVLANALSEHGRSRVVKDGTLPPIYVRSKYPILSPLDDKVNHSF